MVVIRHGRDQVRRRSGCGHCRCHRDSFWSPHGWDRCKRDGEKDATGGLGGEAQRVRCAPVGGVRAR